MDTVSDRPETADRIFTRAAPLPPPTATYTVSARSKAADTPVFAFIRSQYGNVPLREIDSLFGFVERSKLYGGRAFMHRELSERDVQQLNNAGIGIRLPTISVRPGKPNAAASGFFSGLVDSSSVT